MRGIFESRGTGPPSIRAKESQLFRFRISKIRENFRRWSHPLLIHEQKLMISHVTCVLHTRKNIWQVVSVRFESFSATWNKWTNPPANPRLSTGKISFLKHSAASVVVIQLSLDWRSNNAKILSHPQKNRTKERVTVERLQGLKLTAQYPPGWEDYWKSFGIRETRW